MRKLPPILLISSLVVISLSGFTPENSNDNSNLSPAVMNCKPGVYKTYEDFVNQKPLPWKWTGMDIGYTFNSNYAKYFVVFKDENGKKQKLQPSEFWGWRDPDRELYRNGPFVSGKITAVPFYVEYVAKDYISYAPAYFGNLKISPSEWCSADMSSTIMEPGYFFKKHDKTVYNKIQNADCNTTKGFSFGRPSTDCLLKCPDVMCIWKTPKPSVLKGSFTR